MTNGQKIFTVFVVTTLIVIILSSLIIEGVHSRNSVTPVPQITGTTTAGALIPPTTSEIHYGRAVFLNENYNLQPAEVVSFARKFYENSAQFDERYDVVIRFGLQERRYTAEDYLTRLGFDLGRYATTSHE